LDKRWTEIPREEVATACRTGRATQEGGADSRGRERRQGGPACCSSYHTTGAARL